MLKCHENLPVMKQLKLNLVTGLGGIRQFMQSIESCHESPCNYSNSLHHEESPPWVICSVAGNVVTKLTKCYIETMLMNPFIAVVLLIMTV